MSLNGCVKWFNSKKGYGFITVVSSDDTVTEDTVTDRDYFVHFSNIHVSEGNYKRLFPGEYVSFDLGKNKGKDVCINITGINGGKLLADNEEYRYKIYPKNMVPRENVLDGHDQGAEDEDQRAKGQAEPEPDDQ